MFYLQFCDRLKVFQLSDEMKEDPFFALRPEHLSVADFIKLTEKIAANGV